LTVFLFTRQEKFTPTSSPIPKPFPNRSKIYRTRLIVLFLIVDALLAGCSTSWKRQWPKPGLHVPETVEIDSVPFYPQKAFQCGPSALAMALNWSGVPADPDTVAPEVFTPSRKGSLQLAMIAAARRHGRIAYRISGPEALIAELGAGYPVIVLQNLGFSWHPAWHYAVVIGYDLNRGMLIVHSGVTPRKHLSLGAFHRTWVQSDYWGLLVLPPTQLPVTATERAFTLAVVGLERAGQWGAAVEGYRTALTRWPDSLGACIGLGNSFYGSGDKASAERAFRAATHRFPNDGSAFNNLAQVLWDQGKEEDALEAAQKAVELGGPLVEMYLETLEEIQAGRPQHRH